MDLLRGLVADEGMALLLITHDLAVVGATADRVAVMQGGRIVEEGATADLFRAPAHAHTRALLAAARHRPARAQAPALPGPPILRVERSTRGYALPRRAPFAPTGHLRAVDDVSFLMQPGESVGLVGESGCGKSTLTRMILGLDPVQGGRILLDGQPVVAGRMPGALRARVQVVFQDPFGSFDPRWTVDRLVAEPFHLTGRPRDWQDRVAAALAEVGLPADAMRRHIHQFSGGQRQRIAIARALIIRPRLIVLDEAVSALDVQVRAQVLDLLSRLRESHGIAWLFISHDLSVVRSITDRVLVMDRGRIVEDGPTGRVLDAPESAAARRLVAAMPRMPGEMA